MVAAGFGRRGESLLFHVGKELEIVFAKAADVIKYVETGACGIGSSGRIRFWNMATLFTSGRFGIR
jgi:hypothetical protein